MNKQLRYLMIKSIAEKQKSQRRHRVGLIQLEREIEKIQGEDPLCIPKKSSKNT